MAARRLKQTKAAKAARRRYRANKKAGKLKCRGCGKKGWSRGGNARWKCKPGRKKHYYAKSKKKLSSRRREDLRRTFMEVYLSNP